MLAICFSMPTTYIVPEGLRQPRADKVLAAAFPDHSRVAFQRAFDAGLVKRGGLPLSRDATLQPGDEITFVFPETKPSAMTPADIPLEVIFEDQHLLVVNKSSGMVVHPGAATGQDTLVHALLSSWQKPTKLIAGSRSNFPSVRCTRNTSPWSPALRR